MELKFFKTHPEAIVPVYATQGSAGLDLHAMVPYTVFLQPGVRFTCQTGIAIELPEGFMAEIRPRSGLAIKKGLGVINSPGTIDPDYRGEICVLLINHGDTPIEIENGMRIAQMVIVPFVRVELVRSLEDLSATDRGEGGFGSTGQ